MPDSRKSPSAERFRELQPERTSLAWFRTLLGYGALMALAVRHHWHQAGFLFWVSISVLAIVAVILWRYTLSRNLMDVAHSDFSETHVVRDKFLISLAVLSLAILFAVTHIRQLIAFIGNFYMTGRQDIVVSDDQIQVVVNRQNSQRPQQLYRNLQRLGISQCPFYPIVGT
ncbi:Putative inner membrane protein [Salmonella enterica subsp. enterica]|nr:Putative inner membrane protein [Salmonella enterica subsp. enterica]